VGRSGRNQAKGGIRRQQGVSSEQVRVLEGSSGREGSEKIRKRRTEGNEGRKLAYRGQERAESREQRAESVIK
jgi:hypothetical protein